MIDQRAIHEPLGDLIALAEEAILKPHAAIDVFEKRQDRIVGELVAICTAKPSRMQFCDLAKILSICLRRLYLARRAGQADRVINFESAIGHFLPYARQESFEALAWEREQARP